jgi:hypothetical protein
MSRLTTAMRGAHDSRVAAVGAMREAADKQLADLQAEHREMAAAQRKELQEFAAAMRRDSSILIHDLNVERATLSADQRRRLDAFVSDLRHEMADFLHERAAERRAADASQRQSLDAFMHVLRERTSRFLADAHANRMAVHADQSTAHQTWQQFNADLRQSRAGQPTPSAEGGQRDETTTAARLRRPGKRRKTPQA